MHHASWQAAAAAPAPHGHTYSSVAPAAASLARSAVMYTRSGNSPPPCPIGPRGHRSSPLRPSRRRRRGEPRFLEKAVGASPICHRRGPVSPLLPGVTRATRTKTPLARSLSRTMKNRYCIEREGDRRVQWDFSPANCISCRVCGQSAPEPSKAGTDYHPLSLSSLAPSAVCPGPFSMRDIPKALLPGWLLVSLLDTGQLKLGANCSLCWPLRATAGTVQADL